MVSAIQLERGAFTVAGIGLLELVNGPTCSTLSLRDREIMVERELDATIMGDVERIHELEEDLKEARYERDHMADVVEPLCGAWEGVRAAREQFKTYSDDVTMIGALIVPGESLRKVTEALESALNNAERIFKQYDDGELP